MIFFKAFTAGFAATMVFHQGLYALLYVAGIAPSPPFDFSPTEPLQAPAVLSLAFWGGVWGMALWPILARLTGAARWIVGAVLGAIGPSAVAMLIVFPMKGLEVNATIVTGALLLNAAWGIGLVVFMRIFAARTLKE